MPPTDTRPPPDIAGLLDFSSDPDRGLSPFFVGRKGELAGIAERPAKIAGRFAAGHPKPAEGEAVLVTGAPGAGKTSLLGKLREMWPASADGDVASVMLDKESLQSAEALLAAVLPHLPQTEKKAYLALGSRAFGLKIQGFGIEAGVDIGAPLPDGRLKAPLAGIDRTLVLLVDEIQNITPDNLAPECKLLQALHECTHGAPILLVLAGLGNAEEVLDKAGLSRKSMGAVHTLGALTESETAEATMRFFRRFHVRGEVSGWPETIQRWSDGWPMHVHNVLCALARDLGNNGGNLRRIDGTAVKRRASAMRAAYYRTRTSAVFADSPVLAGRVMERIGKGGAPQSECVEIIEEEHGRGGRRSERLPAGMDAGDYFREMVRKGLLQSGARRRGSLACPIPSLRSWCVAAAGGELHCAAIEGQRSDVEDLIANGAQVNARDPAGRTPLHLAVDAGWSAIASLLLAAGADPTIADGEGKTPLDLADDETRVFLVERGGGAAKRINTGTSTAVTT